MEMTILMVAVAMVLLYAIHRGRRVKLSVRLPGTGASLEVTHRHAGRTEARNLVPTGEGDDAIDSAPKSEVRNAR